MKVTTEMEKSLEGRLRIPIEEPELVRFPLHIKYRNAMQILFELTEAAFLEITDKAGRPYQWHLESVREKAVALWRSPNTPWMESTYEDLLAKTHHGKDALMCGEMQVAMVAYAHDLLENTSINTKDLKDWGIPDLVIKDILVLTKKPGGDLDEYYAAVKANPVARTVKIADLLDNIDLSRNIYSSIKEGDIQRTRNYLRRLQYLIE